MSYTIEVFRGNQRAEKHFGIYALYVMFYPQLVAGPIERPQNVLWQFREKFNFDWENIKIGLSWIAWGMFKKVVIADRLALVTDSAYANISEQSGSTLLMATLFYYFQIYCDFSGYSDIALGTARVMGFKLMTNFNAPYLAESISEFWKRWHISLSTWFRDYVFIPLGGNRVSKVRVYGNLMLVFLLSGLWHGADWKFVIWGGIHGIYLVFAQIFKTNHLFRSERGALGSVRAARLFHVIWTFLLVTFAWIFFRARNLDDAFEVIRRIFSISIFEVPHLVFNGVELLFSFGLIAVLILKDRYSVGYWLENKTFYVMFLVICLLCYFFGVFNSNQFIYFQF